MFRNYFSGAVRRLLKNKLHFALNAIGLSVGLACFALIALWVVGELSYDRFHAKVDRIYRVGGLFTDESGRFDQAVTPPPLGPALVADYPEVEATVRLDRNTATVQLGEKQFIESGIILADPAFFHVFDFKILSGDSRTALNEPYNIILSRTMAKKYFGDEDPIGKSLRIFQYDPDGNGAEYKITGVVEDTPINSQFHYNFLVSFKTMEVVEPESMSANGWYWNGYYTYVLLREGSDPKAFEAKLPQTIEKYMGTTNREWKVNYDYFLQPYADIHLGSHLRYEFEPTGNMSFVVIFGSIGVLVMFLACINYVNLSTAFSADRYRDVGMRKVMGAMKNQLVFQYLAESWLLSLFSLILSFSWIELARPLFEALTGKPVVGLYTWSTVTLLFAISSLAGILSGLYPSVLLSSFKPAAVLKGNWKTASSAGMLRKTLVTFQYAVTIFLVIGILVVQRQMSFIQNKDLGFDKENLVILGVNGSREVIRGYDAFANELRISTLISGVARSNTSLYGGLGNSVGVMENADGIETNATIYLLRCDFEFPELYRMKLMAGRFFSHDFTTDSTEAYVVNETTTRAFGYSDPEKAIGRKFEFGGNPGKVIGVVRDFHYSSLQNKVDPTCIFLLGGNFSRISVRFKGPVIESMDLITTMWKKHFPNSVQDFKFAEDSLNNQYQSEQRFSEVFLVFAVISLAIACLGLFALVSYSVEGRTKEIGIRKVLGASVQSILILFSKEFIVLVLAACMIAVPAGYYFMNNWLNNFAYRVELGPGTFLVASLLVLGVAWFTVSARSIGAAVANPADALRSE